MRLHRVTWNSGKRDAIQRGADGKIAVARDQGTRHIDLDAFAALLENPAMQRIARETHPRAIVRPKIAGFPRCPMAAKIIRRRHHGRLGILSDAKRNHVLLDAMARPDAGIEPITHDVGECAVDDDLERYGGIGTEEA